MMRRREIGGRGAIINNIFQKFANDEHLMRLLVYPYEDEDHQYIDCLSPELDDIVGSPEHHEYVQHHIKKVIKQSEINSIRTNKIFLHLGRKHNIYSNHMLSKQEVIVDVITHIDYENYDARMGDILDRVDKLLIDSELTMGKTDMSSPIPYEATNEYYRYQLKYLVWVRK